MVSEEHIEDKLHKSIEARRRARLRKRGPYRKTALVFRQKSSPQRR
ncbi:MAG: hypothetical protein QW304_02710 [Thermoproteota archaeon]